LDTPAFSAGRTPLPAPWRVAGALAALSADGRGGRIAGGVTWPSQGRIPNNHGVIIGSTVFNTSIYR